MLPEVHYGIYFCEEEQAGVSEKEPAAMQATAFALSDPHCCVGIAEYSDGARDTRLKLARAIGISQVQLNHARLTL